MKSVTVKGVKLKAKFRNFLKNIACNYWSVAVYDLEDGSIFLQKERGSDKVWGHSKAISAAEYDQIVDCDNDYQCVLNVLEMLTPEKAV